MILILNSAVCCLNFFEKIGKSNEKSSILRSGLVKFEAQFGQVYRPIASVVLRLASVPDLLQVSQQFVCMLDSLRHLPEHSDTCGTMETLAGQHRVV